MKSTGKFLIFLGLIPAVLLAFYVSKSFWNWDFDDGFIVYRYAENILSGNGWVYNPGEHYNASTSPLNTIIITLVAYFNKNIPAAAHLIGGVSLAVMGTAIYFILLNSAPMWFSSVFAALIVFLMGNNFTWGIETNLFYGLLAAFVCLDLYGRTSWVLLGFLVLARPDALILVMLCTARELFLKKELPLRGFAKLSAVILPWAVFSIYQFGNVFPSTLKQKMWQGASGFWGEGFIFYQGLVAYIKGSAFYHLSGVYWAPVILVIPLVLTPQGLIQIIKEKNYSVLIFIASVLSVLIAYTILNVPNYHWYYTGTIIFSYICAAYGILYVIGQFKFINYHILNVIFIIAALFCSYKFYSISLKAMSDLRTQVYRELSVKIKNDASPADKLAAVEVGVVGYETKLKMVDIVGLTTPYGEFITGENTDKFFDEIKPDFIIMHNPLMKHEEAVYADPRFIRRYRLKGSISMPGYPEVSYFKSENERVFDEGVKMDISSSNNMTLEGDTYKVVRPDPWLEYKLNSVIESAGPIISFEYSLSGPKIPLNKSVLARIYYKNEGEAYSEERAVPVLLRGGQQNQVVTGLSLPGSKNILLKIQRIRLDPIQDLKLMDDSILTVRNLKIAGK